MAYLIQPKKVRLSGNELLVKPLTRREANAFREQMAAAMQATPSTANTAMAIQLDPVMAGPPEKATRMRATPTAKVLA